MSTRQLLSSRRPCACHWLWASSPQLKTTLAFLQNVKCCRCHCCCPLTRRSYQALLACLSAAEGAAAPPAPPGGDAPSPAPAAAAAPAGGEGGAQHTARLVALLEGAVVREAPWQLVVAALEGLVTVAGREARTGPLAHRWVRQGGTLEGGELAGGGWSTGVQRGPVAAREAR